MVLVLHATNEEADLSWVMEDTDIVLLKFTFSNLELSPATQVPSNRGKWSAQNVHVLENGENYVVEYIFT